MNEKFSFFEFNYASFTMEPYSGGNGSSSNLLRSIIQKLNETDFPSDKRIIDRFKDRKSPVKRKIVFISSPFERKGERCFGKIALIKNKSPLLWSGKDIIKEIEKEENQQFIEITNFSVHFLENADPIVMHEFNYEGPRLSDIEFYIRQIAQEFKLAKNIKSIVHLDTDYDSLDRDIKNVFEVTVKVNSAYTNRFNWLKVFKDLNDESGFRDVRLELFFGRKKEKNGNYELNIRGTDFARNFIGWLRKDKNNIKYLEDLKMSYQLSNDDKIVDLDFLKNKVVSIVKIPLTDGAKFKPRDFKALVGEELNFYLDSGKTHKEPIPK